MYKSLTFLFILVHTVHKVPEEYYWCLSLHRWRGLIIWKDSPSLRALSLSFHKTHWNPSHDTHISLPTPSCCSKELPREDQRRKLHKNFRLFYPQGVSRVERIIATFLSDYMVLPVNFATIKSYWSLQTPLPGIWIHRKCTSAIQPWVVPQAQPSERQTSP